MRLSIFAVTISAVKSSSKIESTNQLIAMKTNPSGTISRINELSNRSQLDSTKNGLLNKFKKWKRSITCRSSKDDDLQQNNSSLQLSEGFQFKGYNNLQQPGNLPFNTSLQRNDNLLRRSFRHNTTNENLQYYEVIGFENIPEIINDQSKKRKFISYVEKVGNSLISELFNLKYKDEIRTFRVRSKCRERNAFITKFLKYFDNVKIVDHPKMMEFLLMTLNYADVYMMNQIFNDLHLSEDTARNHFSSSETFSRYFINRKEAKNMPELFQKSEALEELKVKEEVKSLEELEVKEESKAKEEIKSLEEIKIKEESKAKEELEVKVKEEIKSLEEIKEEARIKAMDYNSKLFEKIKNFLTDGIYKDDIKDTEEIKLLKDVAIPLIFFIEEILYAKPLDTMNHFNDPSHVDRRSQIAQIIRNIANSKILNPFNRKKLFSVIIVATFKENLVENPTTASFLISQVEDEKLKTEIKDAIWNMGEVKVTDISTYVRSAVRSALRSTIKNEIQKSIFNMLDAIEVTLSFIEFHSFIY